MFETDKPTSSMSSAFEDLMALIKLSGDPKAFQARLDALTASTVKANDARVAAERAQAALAQRTAELDKREVEIAEEEVETAARRAAVNDRQARLLEIGANITTRGNQFKLEILRYAGLAEHFNQRLQDLPDWDTLARIVLGQPDPHMSGDHQAARREPSGEVERVPDAPAIATVTRTKAPRPTRADLVRGA